MPAPTSYSEAIFADYMISVLGDVASLLGWDAGSVQVQEAVNDTLLDADVSTIASVTDIRQFRALGRRAIWRAVVQATAGNYAFTDVAQQTFNRQQINAQAQQAFNLADSDCRLMGADPDYAVTMVRATRPHDPYTVLPDEERIP